jgi:hypothetical protein
VPGPLNSGPGFFTEVLVLRSLFWRILASFWLAIALVAGLSILLGHMLNQDAWILSRHPGLNTLASRWVQHYEQEGLESSQRFLEQRKRRYKIDVQVLDESGDPWCPAPRAAPPPSKRASTTMTAACPGAA